MRFMDMVMEEVMRAAGNDMAVLVKTNMRDGIACTAASFISSLIALA